MNFINKTALLDINILKHVEQNSVAERGERKFHAVLRGPPAFVTPSKLYSLLIIVELTGCVTRVIYCFVY